MFPGSASFRSSSEIPVPTADSQPGGRSRQQVPRGPRHVSVFTQAILFVPHLIAFFAQKPKYEINRIIQHLLRLAVCEKVDIDTVAVLFFYKATMKNLS